MLFQKLDILYMTRVQKRTFLQTKEDYVRMKDFYILDKTEKWNLLQKDMYILHPLPRVKRKLLLKLTMILVQHILKQAQYGVYVRMALILRLLEVEV